MIHFLNTNLLKDHLPLIIDLIKKENQNLS